jgi:hypothetical protein
MMRGINAMVVALVLTFTALRADAGEMEVRSGLKAFTVSSFARREYQAIEDRYKAALATSERTPSGALVSNLILRNLVTPPSNDLPDGADVYWLPLEQTLDEWAALFPDSSLVAVARSQAFQGHGRSWRGNGFSRTVSPESFRKFDTYTQRAYEALMAREKVGRKDPNWYVEMINISRSQGWDRERSLGLLDEATKAFPYNYLIYTIFANRLAPRWGGSREAVAIFASFAADKTRAVEGESVYARIYWAVGDILDAELSDPDVDWKRINAGFEDLIQRYPDGWNLNHYAKMACAARDWLTTRQVLLRIKGSVEPQAWNDRAHYLRCVDAAGLKREQLQ